MFFPQIVPMIACSHVAELVVALKQWALRKLGKDGEAGSTPAGAGLPHACKVDRARLGSPTVWEATPAWNSVLLHCDNTALSVTTMSECHWHNLPTYAFVACS